MGGALLDSFNSDDNFPNSGFTPRVVYDPQIPAIKPITTIPQITPLCPCTPVSAALIRNYASKSILPAVAIVSFLRQ